MNLIFQSINLIATFITKICIIFTWRKASNALLFLFNQSYLSFSGELRVGFHMDGRILLIQGMLRLLFFHYKKNHNSKSKHERLFS